MYYFSHSVLELHRVRSHARGIPVEKWESRIRIPDADFCSHTETVVFVAVDDGSGDLCGHRIVVNPRLRTHRHDQHVPRQHIVSTIPSLLHFRSSASLCFPLSPLSLSLDTSRLRRTRGASSSNNGRASAEVELYRVRVNALFLPRVVLVGRYTRDFPHHWLSFPPH